MNTRLPARNSQAVTAAKVMRAARCVGTRLHLNYEGYWIATLESYLHIRLPIRKGPERFDAKIKHFRPFGFVGSSVYSIVWPS